MGGKSPVSKFQSIRDKSETFYRSCEINGKRLFCSKTCKPGEKKKDGSCAEWLHRKPLDINNDSDWNMINHGKMILIKFSQVF